MAAGLAAAQEPGLPDASKEELKERLAGLEFVAAELGALAAGLAAADAAGLSVALNEGLKEILAGLNVPARLIAYALPIC